VPHHAARQQHHQALDRIITSSQRSAARKLLMDLSLNTRAFVAQRLIPRRDARGRVPGRGDAHSPLISDLIFKGDVSGIKDIMKRSRELGCRLRPALFDLYEGGLITYEERLRNADSINDLRLQIKLHGKEAKDRNVFAGIGNLNVMPTRRRRARSDRAPSARGIRGPWLRSTGERQRNPGRRVGVRSTRVSLALNPGYAAKRRPAAIAAVLR